MEPDDLKGLKIRVQTSPTNVKMLEALGASPTPMSFGEVYTGLQQNVINSFDVNKNRLNNAKNIITNLNNRYNSLTSLLI